MSKLKDHWQLFKIIMNHKYWVFRAGLLEGVPLWTLVVHDLDKFTPIEWRGYILRHSGTGNHSEKITRALVDPDYQMAWHIHQNRNRHHWHWWITPRDDGTLRMLPMSESARLEMLADWLGFNKLSYEKTEAWYLKTLAEGRIHLHSETRNWVASRLMNAKSVKRSLNDN